MNLEVLKKVQKILSKKVIIRDDFRKPLSQIAGVDLAFTNDLAITVCTTTFIPFKKLINKIILIKKLNYPYIPTLLSFREGPPIIEIINSLEKKPDLFLINAHGLAHPLYCGCASFVGVLTGAATIGVATNNLCGEYEYEPQELGEAVATYFGEKQVGWVLKSKYRHKPIFISPGHKISLSSCLKVVRKCIFGQKLPEPLWLAHKLANEEKRRINSH